MLRPMLVAFAALVLAIASAGALRERAAFWRPAGDTGVAAVNGASVGAAVADSVGISRFIGDFEPDGDTVPPYQEFYPGCAQYGMEQVVSSPVREGSSALELTVHPGDTDEFGGESCELVAPELQGYALGTDEYYGESLYFPSPLSDAPWLIVRQDRYSGVLDTPERMQLGPDGVLSQQMSTGLCTDSGCAYQHGYDIAQIQPDTWYDVITHYHWATDDSGVLEIWVRHEGESDFTKVVSVSGIPTQQYGCVYECVDEKGNNVSDGTPHGTIDKLSIYRDAGSSAETTSVVHDNFRVSPDYATAVAGFVSPPLPPPPPPRDPAIVAAGDIACAPSDTGDPCQALAVSVAIAAANPTAVLPLGDDQYEDGALADFQIGYDASWGRFKSLTHPIMGNHEYGDGAHDAGGYFAYFGAAANPDPQGYYSYDLGSWHLIALNSECVQYAAAGCSEPEMESWLKADLAAHPNVCTLAYWHRPRFSSGINHGSDPTYAPLWDILYQGGADVVLNGHDHDYERFAPQRPDKTADPFGLREFVVGTGGKNQNGFQSTPAANSEVRANGFGVLELTLHPDSYDWQFVNAAGSTIDDSGSDSCH